ncbi:MAG TPA: 2-succinyl-5-enolpyruvyl-6-hydroxy-3-cyclohexene-1-carboxylic-acid synthase [Longimicrobiales bacterium]|nr:2-succinyl-5-enolpyruvyl-6-hydroxy-3-cyclohexene-1-carboxylic-acid synthase [Longimicrobiales bacterium]
MSHGAANTIWARSFADELARAGVRDVVLAPGSRSTPLVLAFARDGRFRLRVHLDERSAAFFALGAGKASGMPAVVLTTSGTAAANVLPAAVEASESETPLLILTADRPPRLRGADANQTIDQVRMYGTHVRDSFDVAPPALGGPELRHLRSLACRAAASSKGPRAGPVHVNFPFDKPLEPVEPPESFARDHPLALRGRPDGAPFVQVLSARASPAPDEVDAVAELLSSPRGVIVAGPCPDQRRVGPAVARLARETGYPVLADPLSGARHGIAGGAHVVAAYDLILRERAALEELRPTVILRVGNSPTSSALMSWILHHEGVAHVVVDAGERWKDHGATATRYVRADAVDTLNALAERAGRAVSEEWAARWRAVERAALEAMDADAGEPHEGELWGAILAAAPPGGALFVSSSMPVRDLDAFGHPRRDPLLVLGNRGASGIDGIVSTAFGVASRSPGPTICVLGDLAFFHDQNGLLWSREDDARVVFVLVDNDGGGIFHALPVAGLEPDFTSYFATPHGLDFHHVAALHGVPFRDVGPPELREALEAAIRADRTTVLRVRSERAANRRRHDEVGASVARRVREALQGR